MKNVKDILAMLLGGFVILLLAAGVIGLLAAGAMAIWPAHSVVGEIAIASLLALIAGGVGATILSEL
jgi:hypothetical protein